MRRLIAVLAVALIAPALATATPASAQAAPIDPTGAVKKRFKNNHGVSISEVGRTVLDGKTFIAQHINGKYQFGKSGIVASDYTMRLRLAKELREELERQAEESEESNPEFVRLLTSPMHVISVKGTSYISGGIFSQDLPEGKTWVKLPGPAARELTNPSGQRINVFESRTLRTVLASTSRKGPGGVVDGSRTTLYRGKMTYAKLYAVSPSFRKVIGERPKGKAGKTVVNWQIWFDGKGHPRRVLTTIDDSLPGSKVRSSTDTRFGDWGARVVVKAPPKAQIADPADLDGELPELPTEFLPIR